MKAEEARKLSESNKETTEQVLERIAQQANLGYDSLICPTLGRDAEYELMILGYKISLHKDIVNGLESYLVSW